MIGLLKSARMRCVFINLNFLIFILCLCSQSVFAQSFEQARDLIRRGQFAEALRVCDAGLKARPRDYQILTIKGIALQGLGRNQDSLAAFRQALRIQPKFLPALQGAAQLEYQLSDPQCRKTLEALLQIRPEPTAHAMLGALAFERKDCAAAIKHYGEAGTAANHPIVKWQRAMCHYQLGQWGPAETQFRELLATGENDQIRYNLALTQLEGKKFADAIATLESPGRKQTTEADALSLLAAAYNSNKQVHEAIEVLRRAIALHPREERLYADLAAICLEHNAIPIGIEVLEVGARNIPDSARIQTMLGVLHIRSNQAEKGKEAFKRARQIAPDATYSGISLAVALIQLGAVEEAINQLREELQRAPGDLRICLTLAQALLQKDSSPAELQEAQTLLRRVTESEPNNARVHSLLGKVYLRRDETANAARALETAIRLDSSDRNATYQLMTLYRKSGRLKEALALQGKVQRLLEAERTEEAEAARYRLFRVPEGRPPQ
jgi:tetratricopeptide (TPR) repeat protein